MRRFAFSCAAGLISLLFQAGCHDNAPPPPRVPVPTATNRDQLIEREYVKPLPREDWRETRLTPTAPAAPSRP